MCIFLSQQLKWEYNNKNHDDNDDDNNNNKIWAHREKREKR